MRLLRVHMVDVAVLQRDHRFASFYDGIVAGQPGPRDQPDARHVLPIDHLAGFDLHGLGMRPRRVPMQFRLAVQVELASAGIVGSADRSAFPIFEPESRGAIGGRLAGAAIEGHPRGVDRDQGMLGLAFIRHGQRDIHRAVGIESLVGLMVLGMRAVHQIVSVRVHGRQAQFDLLQFHLVGILRLAHVFGCDAADGAALRRLGGLDVDPVLRRGHQLRRHGRGFGRSLLAQFSLLEPVGRCNASQQQNYGHQDEPARASHGYFLLYRRWHRL